MNTQEMLGLAAKAAGKLLVSGVTDNVKGVFTTLGWWNPLEDDGDCARMEAAIGINVMWGLHFVSVERNRRGVYESYENHPNDRTRVRRYASTRLAAEIGKDMP